MPEPTTPNTPAAPAAPAAAAAPTPAPAPAPEAPPTPPPLRVKYNHKDVEIPPEEIPRYVTKGMAAAKLEEDKAAWKAQQAEHAQKLQLAETVLQLQRDYPDRWKLMLAASQGEKLRRAGDEEFSEDEDLTGRKPSPTLPPEYARRLEGLEQGYQTLQSTFHQKELQAQINAAIAAQPFLRDKPGLAGSIRERIEDGLAAGRYQTPEEAAIVLATEQRDLLQAELEREHKAREERLQAAAPPTGNVVIPRPEIDKSALTYKALKDGSFKRAWKEALQKTAAAITPPN